MEFCATGKIHRGEQKRQRSCSRGLLVTKPMKFESVLDFSSLGMCFGACETNMYCVPQFSHKTVFYLLRGGKFAKERTGR